MGEADNIAAVQTNLNYRFRQPELLRLALTHPSYAHEHPDLGGEEHHNQRLEFLGDAALDFLVASWLYKRFPAAPEGLLTRMRATLVRTTSLARLARHLGLGDALWLGHGEADSGGSDRDANLCDVLEATVGALYLDGGLEVVWERLAPWFEREVAAAVEAESYVDAKSRFQEWAQAELNITPTYRIISEEGPAHSRMFTAQVLLKEEIVGEGRGPSKREAEQLAARAALKNVRKEELLP